MPPTGRAARKSNSVPVTSAAGPAGMPRSPLGSQSPAGSVSSHHRPLAAPAVRYGCDPVPYGAAAEPTFRALMLTCRPWPASSRYLASSSRQNG